MKRLGESLPLGMLPAQQRFGDGDVVPRVCPEGIVGHELLRDLYGEFVIETAQDIDITQF